MNTTESIKTAYDGSKLYIPGAEVRIVTAAVQVKTARYPKGFILSLPRPARHSDVILAAYDLLGKALGDHEQGFLTSEGGFVTREVAYVIARLANQIIEKHGNETELFSEDLW